jgi:hypothetical protein
MAQQAKALPAFTTEQATLLLFPERMVTDSFKIEFHQDRILVSISGKYDLNTFIKTYQEAYLRERINDTKWLSNHVCAIASMCTNGCVPYIDYVSRDKWVPPTDSMEISLTWLGQNILLIYCGNFGETFYYEAKIKDSNGKIHTSGNEILLRMVLMQDSFAKHHLRHAFKCTSYKTRLSVPIDDMEVKTLHVIKERVTPIALEVFSALGGKSLPDWVMESDQGRNERLYTGNTPSKDKDIAPKEVWFALKYFQSARGPEKKLEVDFSLEIKDTSFPCIEEASSQIGGIEAMNLFLIKCQQLKRELSC